MSNPLHYFSWLLLAVGLLPSPVQANFHLWDINEIYSNTDGSVQFVEFFTTSASQNVLGTHVLTCRNAAVTLTNTFTLPTNLPPTSTANRFFLVATPGFASAPGGITPDYVMPSNFLFRTGGRLSLVSADTNDYPSLPANVSLSVDRTGVTATNSPRNFAGQQGLLLPPNIAPTVTIANPTNNARFAALATFLLQATAMDSDGTVTNVQFFTGTTSIGSVPAPPFQFNVIGLTAGSYSLTARAADNRGAMATSAPVNITVVTPVDIVFNAPVLSATDVTLTFSATPGLLHMLEKATNLPPTSWMPDGSFTPAPNTNRVTVTRPRAGLPPILYWRAVRP